MYVLYIYSLKLPVWSTNHPKKKKKEIRSTTSLQALTSTVDHVRTFVPKCNF